METNRYLSRIGLDPGDARPPTRESLARIQRAHVTTVPFETLAITGDPYGDREGEGVSLAPAHLYEKIVESHRGGFCYELNGLCYRLLDELGFDVAAVAAGMVGDDGDPAPPANHRSTVVDLDRRYVVDVGMGAPVMRAPLPLDGRLPADEAGVEWRCVESDRPDADWMTQYRRRGDDEWTNRYVFAETPRERCYFRATCDYLATAPESTFTGDPYVRRATQDGHLELEPGSFTRFVAGEAVEERTVEGAAWHDLLEREFGLRYRSD